MITARGVISIEDGKDIEMRLLQQETNRLVRYSWRPHEWESDLPETVLTFEIDDLGVSRQETGEGITITITHDGWVEAEPRNRQERLLKAALQGLAELLEKKRAKPWWKQPGAQTGYTKIQLITLKEFCEAIEKENRGKSEKKLGAQNMWKLCQQMDSSGDWAADGEEGYLLMQNERRLFGVQRKSTVTLYWPELEQLVGKRKLKELANRLALEQDVDVGPSRKQDVIPGSRVHVDLLVRWFADLIEESRTGDPQ